MTWEERERPCVVTLEDGAEIWRCGRLENPLRLTAAIKRSLVVLKTAPGAASTVDELAMALLDSGSADVVLVDPNWPKHRNQLLDDQVKLGTGRQMIVVTMQASPVDLETMLLPRGVPFFWNDTSNPSFRLPLCPAWSSVFASRNQLQSGACGRHL